MALNGKFTITLPFDKTHKLNTYKVVYVNEDSEIVEIIEPTIKDDQIILETTHLSTYGVVGYNSSPNQRIEDTTTTADNPKIADNIVLYIILALLSAAVGYLVFKKTKRSI